MEPIRTLVVNCNLNRSRVNLSPPTPLDKPTIVDSVSNLADGPVKLDSTAYLVLGPMSHFPMAQKHIPNGHPYVATLQAVSHLYRHDVHAW